MLIVAELLHLTLQNSLQRVEICLDHESLIELLLHFRPPGCTHGAALGGGHVDHLKHAPGKVFPIFDTAK